MPGGTTHTPGYLCDNSRDVCTCNRTLAYAVRAYRYAIMPRDIRARQRVSQACVPCGQRKTKVRLRMIRAFGEALTLLPVRWLSTCLQSVRGQL
jgi:hypothetical protein